MKKRGISLIIVILLFTLMGCVPNPPVESKIKKDISEYNYFTQRNLIIEGVKILKRQTNKKDKQDIVYCQVVSTDKNIRYTESYITTYVYYDQGGWSLEKVDNFEENNWNRIPLTGIKTDELISLIQQSPETYQLLDITYDKIEIINQTTDLGNLSDKLTIQVTKKSELIDIDGTYDISFTFDTTYGIWNVESSIPNEDFHINWKIVGTWEGTVDSSWYSSWLTSSEEPMKIYIKDVSSNFIINEKGLKTFSITMNVFESGTTYDREGYLYFRETNEPWIIAETKGNPSRELGNADISIYFNGGLDSVKCKGWLESFRGDPGPNSSTSKTFFLNKK